MKERLTGAIILVALMVLLVPELLTGPIRTKSRPAASSTAAFAPPARAGRTSSAQAPLRTYTLTLSAAPPARDSAAAPAAQSGSVDAPRQTTPQSAIHEPAPSPPREPAPAGEGASTPGASAHRRASANTAAEEQAPRSPRRDAGARSSLQAAKPAAHRAVREASASASSGGWVVQLGSFADRRNAVRLARSLEARGYRMSVSPARAGSRVLWRVRTGSVRDRAGALHVAARLRSLGHRGEVLPVR